jgi:TolB-like protein
VTATFRFGRFELNPATRQLLVDRQPVPLGARAFDVLLALIERRDRVVTKNEMLDLVWPGLVVEENNLQVQISTLRKVLGPDAVATISGRGYQFTLNLEAVPASESHAAAIPSIAVLPFANVSDDSSNEYFADGLSEELLNVLAKIRGLRVASRTSAFYFKGKNADLPTIAQSLNVATVLQGSVRKAGNRVRIAVQLIHAATDTHLWSETYDRDLGDVFAVQDDIARAVVTELRAALVGAHLSTSQSARVTAEVAMAVKGRAENVEVHRLYLEGKFFLERQTSEGIAKGIGLLERAVDRDPTYALAWATLSRAYVVRSWIPVTRVSPPTFDLARAAAEQALTMQPDLPDGHAALGWVRMLADWDWNGAKESLERALELAPEHVDALRYASLLMGNVGHLDEALKLSRRVAALDPLSWNAFSNLANYFLGTGFPDEAGAAVEKSIELNPHSELTQFILGKVRLDQRRPDDALTAFQRMSGALRLMGVALAQFARGSQQESDEALRELIERYADDNAFQIAQACAYRREFDLSFLWLERAYEQHAAELCQVKWDPLLRNLRGDQRWHVFLDKMGLAH